jgi:dTMP kinase
MRGLFISFEGIDGAGKSTHIAALAQRFSAQGREVTLTREPGGTPLAERLRNMVLNEPMDPMTEALLVFAARRDHVVQVIRPALEKGHVVICDRFTDSTFAYQGAGRSFDWNVLSTLEQWVQADGTDGPHALLQPELTLWFDLNPDIAAQRLAGARVPDKFESQPADFFAQVASGYAKRMAQDAKRFARIDSSQIPEEVWRQVESAVQAKGLLS